MRGDNIDLGDIVLEECAIRLASTSLRLVALGTVLDGTTMTIQFESRDRLAGLHVQTVDLGKIDSVVCQ